MTPTPAAYFTIAFFLLLPVRGWLHCYILKQHGHPPHIGSSTMGVAWEVADPLRQALVRAAKEQDLFVHLHLGLLSYFCFSFVASTEQFELAAQQFVSLKDLLHLQP